MLGRVSVFARQAGARQMSTTVAGVKYGKSFTQQWLGDKGAWPVIGVLGFAVCVCSGFVTRKTMFHPDIRITSAKRRADIRDW